jgi:hypothetical protein
MIKSVNTSGKRTQKNVYSLEDINVIKTQGFSCLLPDKSLALIKKLASLVGSDQYVKTPNFPKKKKNFNIVKPEDWALIKNFKPTERPKHTDSEKLLNTVKGALNKITDKNYDIQKTVICDLLNSGISEEDYAKITELILNIASTNKFYSKVYADLFDDLIRLDERFVEKLDKEIDGYLSKFGDIIKTDSNADYELFCQINAENEKRKALSMFLVNLMINKVVSTTKIISLIHSLINNFSQHVVKDDVYHFTVEISENLFILISNGFNMINESDSDAAGDIKNEMKNFTKLKVKDTPSLNNKIRFQLLDLLDMI